MASSAVQLTYERQLEDPLSHLPCSSVVEYPRDQIIYSQDQLSTGLYLVIDGRVKVSRVTDEGRQFVLDIYQRDEFFGESAFVNQRHDGEQATALENTTLMVWTRSVVENMMTLRPGLGLALLRILTERCVDFTERIQSFSHDSVERRLARSLIYFSERRGVPQQDGWVSMIAFTHELLSQYVGTSRELISHHMNRFRDKGYVQYSRKCIVLHRGALRDWLRQPRQARQLHTGQHETLPFF